MSPCRSLILIGDLQILIKVTLVVPFPNTTDSHVHADPGVAKIHYTSDDLDSTPLADVTMHNTVLDAII